MPAPLTPDVLPAANPDASAPYEFRHEIARGGMGSILEAADCKLGRTVAVKVMLAEMKGDGDHKQRFINEAAVLARLAHPNIVPVYDIGRDSAGQLYYSMKLVKGRTLRAILNELPDGVAETAQTYTLNSLLTIFRKVCDALAFAHSRGIIHRDLKPENIMVGEFGEVLVMDWGLAKLLRSNDEPSGARQTAAGCPEGGAQRNQTRMPNDETDRKGSGVSLNTSSATNSFDETIASSASDTLRRDALRRLAHGTEFGVTLEGDVMGTPQYMSPEQAEGRIVDMDARSDVFSLGGILYTILTLRPPVEGTTLEEVLRNVISGTITAPSAFNGGSEKAPSSVKVEVLEARKIKPLPHCPGGRVPAALSAVVMKALSVKREARYQNVAALSADVEAYQNGFATSAENAGAWKQFTLFVKRHKAASLGVAAVLLVGATLGTKAIIEGQRAEKALADLKKNAPAMLALAESEALAQHHESALEKTDAALRLDPDLLDAYWRRAWGLIALGRFSEAASAMRVASERDPSHARQLSVILPQIQKIAAVPDEAGRFAPDMLTPVFEFLNTHDARGEAGALIEHLRLTNKQRFAIAQERLRALSGATVGLSQDASGLIELNPVTAKLKSPEQVRGIPCDTFIAREFKMESLEPLRGLRLSKLMLYGNRISDLGPLRGMALVHLDLSGSGNSAFSDLSPLAGMPLRNLNLLYCPNVSDVSPLHGMPLEDLDLYGTAVTDLGPLAGMPLRSLDIGGTALSDLRPLVGMPLRSLTISNMGSLSDISPLADLPLKSLVIRGSRQLKDLTPLLRIPTLERLETDHSPAVLAPLRQHPKLALINYQQKGFRPAAEVWAEIDAKQIAREQDLVQAQATREKDLAQIEAALSAIGFAGTINEKTAWGRRLGLDHQSISDVTPLRSLPIGALSLANTKVADLSPLRGMRLKEISFVGTAVTDVRPLLDMPILEAAMIPERAGNIEFLRHHPTLKYLGWPGDFDNAALRPKLTTADFWQRYDAQKAKQKQ